MKLLGGFRFQKKYLAFFTVIPLLVATSFVQVDCPVCDGTGDVTNSLGMDNVIIRGIESEEIGTMYHACGLFLMYGYNVKITLENQGDQDAIGWLKMVLIDYEEGTKQDTQYSVVEVPARQRLEFLFRVWFSSNHDKKKVTEVKGAVLTGEVADETCAGTGKVALNQLPLVDNLKKKLQQLYVAEVPWAPPALWEWADDEDNLGESAFSGYYDPFSD